MTRLEMVEKMRITIVEMSEILDRAELKDTLDVPLRSEELKSDFVTEAYKWLSSQVYEQYKNVLEIWKLLPKELWDRYKTWGEFGEHRESVLLEERLAVLRKIVRDKSRPDLFKRSKINARIKALDKKANRRKSKKSDNGVSEAK